MLLYHKPLCWYCKYYEVYWQWILNVLGFCHLGNHAVLFVRFHAQTSKMVQIPSCIDPMQSDNYFKYILFEDVFIVDSMFSLRRKKIKLHAIDHVVASWPVMSNWIAYGHDDVIKWKSFPRYWTFVRGIHRSPVNSPHKGQWRGTLNFSFICSWIKGWVNNGDAGDLRHHGAHYDVTVMIGETDVNVLMKIDYEQIMSCSMLYFDSNLNVFQRVQSTISYYWYRKRFIG